MRFKRRKEERELQEAISRGRMVLRASEPDEAMEYLGAAVQSFPGDPEIRVLYASILLLFDPERVAPEAAKAAELGQNNPSALVQAASLLLDRMEIESARSAVRRARELAHPEFVLMSGLVNLEGLLAALDGKDRIAEEKLRLAIDMALTTQPTLLILRNSWLEGEERPTRSTQSMKPFHA